MNDRARVGLSWFDRALISIAPAWGLKRVRARVAARMYARHYEAAAASRRTVGWRKQSTDANAALVTDQATLRDLSRDLRRNNGWAKRGVQVIVNNTVGWGISPRVTGPRSKKAIQAWKAWADSPNCNYDGTMPFAGMQALAMTTIVEAGEVLIVKEAANKNDALPVPFRIRVLEPDYLDTAKSCTGPNGNPIISGIELDGRGRRVAYWIYDKHPGALLWTGANESKRVDASRVIHCYEVNRPGQMRGVPWLASSIARLHDFDDYEDASLMQQKIAACFGAFVSEADDGTRTELGPDGLPVAKEDPVESLEPGMVSYLNPGETVSFAQPPAIPGQDMFSRNNLRRIAAGMGVTYEDLTGDYSQVNFSSARMARLAHWANVHSWRWNMLIPQMCEGVWKWVMEDLATLSGWREIPRAEWSPPPMPMLDPDKEGLAYTRLVRSGMQSLSGALRELGEDPETHFAQIAADNERLDRLKIVLDSDPRRTTTGGQAQQVASAPAKEPPPKEEEPEPPEPEEEPEAEEEDSDGAES